MVGPAAAGGFPRGAAERGEGGMTAEEVPRALSTALDAGRVEVTRHFWDELRADAFALVDVRSAIESIIGVRDVGTDRGGHPKFEVTGTAIDRRRLSMVCSYKEESDAFLLITVYEAE